MSAEAHGGVQFLELGVADQGSAAMFAPKEPGKHRWGAFMVYRLTEEMVRHEMGYRTGDPATILDHETRVSFHIACVDCEESYPDINPDTPCRAPETEWWADL